MVKKRRRYKSFSAFLATPFDELAVCWIRPGGSECGLGSSCTDRGINDERKTT
jgi:hypothetical protein